MLICTTDMSTHTRTHLCRPPYPEDKIECRARFTTAIDNVSNASVGNVRVGESCACWAGPTATRLRPERVPCSLNGASCMMRGPRRRLTQHRALSPSYPWDAALAVPLFSALTRCALHTPITIAGPGHHARRRSAGRPQAGGAVSSD